MLNSLPESLDATYERMLCTINHYLVEDARRILTLLCFASRPLAVKELIDGVAVEIDNSTGLNLKRGLQDANGIRDICGAFIDVGLGFDHTIEYYGRVKENELTPTVRIAHFSIQEYLESERIRHQKAAIFSLTSAAAHAEIAQLCLVYLLEPDLSRSKLDLSVCKEFPLAHFAAMYWYYHYQKTAKNAPGLDNCILRLFRHQSSFETWIMLHDIDQGWETAIDFSRNLDDIASPVYYASLLGLDHALLGLTYTNRSESTANSGQPLVSTSKVSERVNAQGRCFGNALYAASYKGHNKIVQILLDKGADVNAQGGLYGNALQAASKNGHEAIVQILLDRGADVNIRGGAYGNALYAASNNGHEAIVQILLDRGADDSAESLMWGSALQAASSEAHDNIVQILLDRGADINAQRGALGTALQRASQYGHDIVVRMLLDREADVNARDEHLNTPLQVASYKGHETTVQMLLEAGADVNAQDSYGNSPLSVAVRRGNEKVMPMLLEKGANLEKVWQAASSASDNELIRQLRKYDSVLRHVSPALEGI